MGDKYGVTPQGFVPMRMDELLNEIHEDLTADWGVNTRLNPQSYLSSLIANFADKLTVLWETGHEVYSSQYPSSACDVSLDNVGQIGGSYRGEPRKTVFPLHCTGIDGTAMIAGSSIMVATNTNPRIEFECAESKAISRNDFATLRIRVAAVINDALYTIVINGDGYSYHASSNVTENEILNGLRSELLQQQFLTVTIEGSLLVINDPQKEPSNTCTLSDNLTTESVTTVVKFASTVYGRTDVPIGTITVIVKGITGFDAVINTADSIAGALRETDALYRQSYTQKIFNRSERMIDSLKAALLIDVPGVLGCRVYENVQDFPDEWGRYPHSIEVVIRGGSDSLIAETINRTRAAGINTYSASGTNVTVIDEEGESIVIRFTRPSMLFCWFLVNVTQGSQAIPADYTKRIQQALIARIDALEPGADVAPQHYEADVIEGMPGIAYADIFVYTSLNPLDTPVFTERCAIVGIREVPITDAGRITVSISA